jgi:hypothetical protein
MPATNPRIRDDDVLIDVPQTRELMGGISTSAAYDDPELMALKIKVGAEDSPQTRVRFIEREVRELLAQRVARSSASATARRAQAEKRAAQRRQKRRLRASAIESVRPQT